MKRALWLLLPFAASACGGSNVPPPDIAQSRAMIWDTIKAYHDAGDKGDTDRMAAYLAPEVSMFKGQEDFSRGRDECVRELVNRVKAYEGQSRNTLLGREVISVTGDIAVTTYVASVGTQRAPITAVFRRQGDKWLIIHLHESWPGKP